VRRGGGAWLGTRDQHGTLRMFCDVGVREMGVSMVIAAWGEGVNVCLCPPSPSSDRSSFAQNARKKKLAEAWTLKEKMFYAVGVCVMGV
jgi:hypothetical protein